MPRVTINGFEMHYEDAGSGPPVVYVHGGFASLDTALADSGKVAWTWENDFAGFHFITYDRRGCYRSSCPEKGYELANQAHDLEGLLDHLHVASAHIIASSAGGPIGMTFAAIAPGHVRSLILVGTGLNLLRRSDPIAELVRQLILVLERDGAEAAFDQRPAEVQVSFKVLWEQAEMAERGALQEYWEEQRALARQAAELPKAERVRRYAAELHSIQAYMNVDTSAHAKQIAVPTLVLHGSNDREVPLAWAEETARVIPNAELRIMQGASHSLVIRYPEARHVVKEWIARIERTTIESRREVTQ